MTKKREAAAGLPASLGKLSAANVADALIKLGRPLRVGPFGLKPVKRGLRAAGPAIPVRHFGSVDVFLEALGRARPGSVIVIDNGGRTDEGTIGDLIVREFKLAGVAGVILWGTHRDSDEILDIGLPLWSLGAVPPGPRKATRQSKTAFARARLGKAVVTPRDYVVADDDGAVFFRQADLAAVAAAAEAIRAREGLQAKRQNRGLTLRGQLRFDAYLERKKKNRGLTFRRYLQDIKGAIEV